MRIPKFLALGIFGLLLFGGGVVAGYARWYGKVRPYPEIRSQRVVTLAATTSDYDTVVLGDSIGEGIALAGPCGSTFNAAVGYTESRHVRMLGRPKLIIVFIGANDWPHLYRRDVSALIGRLPRPLILVDTSPTAATKAFASGLAKRAGIRLVSTVGIETVDGVHPSVRGARTLKKRVEEACSELAEIQRAYLVAS